MKRIQILNIFKTSNKNFKPLEKKISKSPVVHSFKLCSETPEVASGCVGLGEKVYNSGLKDFKLGLTENVPGTVIQPTLSTQIHPILS